MRRPFFLGQKWGRYHDLGRIIGRAVRDEHRVRFNDERGKAMSSEPVLSSAKLALLSAALLLLVAACGEEKSEPANQGTAPTTQGTSPSTEQPATPEAGQQAPKQ